VTTIRIILHGKAAGDARLRTAVYTLRKDGHHVEVRVTWEPGDAVRLTAEAVANEVFAAAYAAGLPGECSLGVLPQRS
jgi:diacylglycerol kinase family enzyme